MENAQVEGGINDVEQKDLAAFRTLRTPVGQRLLTWLQEQGAHGPDDPLQRAARARRTVESWDPALPIPITDLVAAALTQHTLRLRAERKWGPMAQRLHFTPNGVEQATRASVAHYRAHRIAARLGHPVLPVADLGCGIGADLAALAAAGLPVRGIDRDPLTVAAAQANIEALALTERADAQVGDVAELAEAPDRLAAEHSAVFCDPARRGTRGRVFNPRDYSPPWDTVLAVARAASGACVKVAPGIAHDLVPPHTGAEWISVDGDVKEAALWFGSLSDGKRRATLLSEKRPSPNADSATASASAPAGGIGDGNAANTLSIPWPDGGGDAALVPETLAANPGLGDPPVVAVGDYLYEPDKAVIRAGLVAEAAALVDGALIDPNIAYVTSDSLVDTPLCRALRVTAVMPFAVKRLRAALRERRAGTVTIKKRGFAADVDTLRASLRVEGPNSIIVVLTRIGNRPVSILCEEVTTV